PSVVPPLLHSFPTRRSSDLRSAMLDLPGGAAHYAISSFFDGYRQSDSVYSYRADLHDVAILEKGKLKLAAGTAQITSRITHAQLDRKSTRLNSSHLGNSYAV